MAQRQATRAEIAVATGLSKPTVSESVRRLSAAGVVVDTGERTTGRGRIGTYYALPATIGCALVVSIAPEGVVAEAVDVYGEIVARSRAGVSRAPGERMSPGPCNASPARSRAAAPVRSGSPSSAPPTPSTVRPGGSSSCRTRRSWSARSTRRPCWPSWSTGPVTVDNDVNWTARAEHGGRDFVYVFLGEGLGCAVVSDGEVRRGHAGLAGEIAHVPTVGPEGWRCGSPRSSRRSAFAVPARPRSTCRRCCVPSSPTEAVADALAKAVGGRARGSRGARRPGGRAGRRAMGSRACSPRWRASSLRRRGTSRSKRPPSTMSRRWRGRVRRPAAAARRRRRRRAATFSLGLIHRSADVECSASAIRQRNVSG